MNSYTHYDVPDMARLIYQPDDGHYMIIRRGELFSLRMNIYYAGHVMGVQDWRKFIKCAYWALSDDYEEATDLYYCLRDMLSRYPYGNRHAQRLDILNEYFRKKGIPENEF